MSETIERFQIHVDASVLEDLHRRLAWTRFPDHNEGTGWEVRAAATRRTSIAGTSERDV